MNANIESAKIRAFIIGPIGDRDAEAGSEARNAYEEAIEVLEYVISPACKALDIESIRADQISRAGEIHEQIFRNLRDSHIVIADLTGANPNVMYELGLRHTTGKLTLQIGEKGRLPFDISTIRTILFKRTEAGLISAKRSLISALAEGLELGSDPVAATRIWLESPSVIFESDPSGGTVSAQEIEDGPGFLEQLADMEAGIADMTQTAVRGASILEEISCILQSGTQRVQNLAATPHYSAQKLSIANNIAQELRDPAVRFNVVAQDFKSHVERAAPGVEYMLRSAAEDPEQLSEAPEFLDTFYSLIDVSEASATNSENFAKSMESSGDATRMMKQVTRSIRNSALSMAETSRKIAGWRELAAQIRI